MEDGLAGVTGHNARRLVGLVCKPVTDFVIVQHHIMVNSVMEQLVKFNDVKNTRAQVFCCLMFI